MRNWEGIYDGTMTKISKDQWFRVVDFSPIQNMWDKKSSELIQKILLLAEVYPTIGWQGIMTIL